MHVGATAKEKEKIIMGNQCEPEPEAEPELVCLEEVVIEEDSVVVHLREEQCVTFPSGTTLAAIVSRFGIVVPHPFLHPSVGTFPVLTDSERRSRCN